MIDVLCLITVIQWRVFDLVPIEVHLMLCYVKAGEVYRAATRACVCWRMLVCITVRAGDRTTRSCERSSPSWRRRYSSSPDCYRKITRISLFRRFHGSAFSLISFGKEVVFPLCLLTGLCKNYSSDFHRFGGKKGQAVRDEHGRNR